MGEIGIFGFENVSSELEGGDMSPLDGRRID